MHSITQVDNDTTHIMCANGGHDGHDDGVYIDDDFPKVVTAQPQPEVVGWWGADAKPPRWASSKWAALCGTPSEVWETVVWCQVCHGVSVHGVRVLPTARSRASSSWHLGTLTRAISAHLRDV
jgi:hypothetical protein